MDPDRVEWPETISVDEVVERYAYPGEPQSLGALASRFPGVGTDRPPGEAMGEGIFPLVDGLERADYGDPEGSPEWWTEELKLALGALCYGADLVAAWRAVAQLPEEEIERILRAARERSTGS